MDFKRLRQQCEARLRTLDLSRPFDAHTFCRDLTNRRGRPIVLRPMDTGGRMPGLWVCGASADLIFYEQRTSPLHQEHIILHELCHLLCDHRPAPVSDADFAKLLFPDLNPDTVQHVLQRTAYSTEQEREAELLASLILERVTRPSTVSSRLPNSEDGPLLRRLEASLEEEPKGKA